jgi:serine/threonine protein kinase
MAGYQIGSFDYMAPERFNDQPTTPAADVYSLACVLYEVLTGRTPFASRSLEQAVRAAIAAAQPRPSGIDPRVSVSFDDVIAWHGQRTRRPLQQRRHRGPPRPTRTESKCATTPDYRSLSLSHWYCSWGS